MIKSLSKSISALCLSLFLVMGFPLSVFAETTTQAPTTSASDTSAPVTAAPAPATDPSPPVSTTPPATTIAPVVEPSPQAPTTPAAQGPQQPTGDSATTYTFNASTGLWENNYYTWNPKTNQTQPKTSQTYSFNPQTRMWDTTEWLYDAPSHTYVANVLASTPVAPAAALKGTGIFNTGPESINTANTNTTNTGVYDLFYNASISNYLNSTAHSGNASVLGNTNGGSALTGDASILANIINVLQSTWNTQQNGGLLAFSKNISGNVIGDLLIDPSQIQNTGPLSVNTATSNTQNDLTVNVKGNGLINNQIVLDAGSGDAAVANNTNGGNATSGSATATADVLNVLNSGINAGQSFLGVVNIKGDFNGDILLPEGYLNAVINGTGPNSTATASANTSNDLQVNTNASQAINNTIGLDAQSGEASVANNTNGGNATTGLAGTKLNVLNLTGQNLTGTNGLLVIVNNMGTWSGILVNAPGSSSVGYCGGTCTASSNIANTAVINQDTHNTINNDIAIKANSGHATVNNNTTGGNASTGDASASVNLINISNSKLSLSNWFGVLFINVFGSWAGSFGTDTAAGTAVSGHGGGADASSADLAGTPSNGGSAGKVFGFIPRSSASRSSTGSNGSANNTSSDGNDNAKVLGSSSQTKPPTNTSGKSKAQLSDKSGSAKRNINLIAPLVSFVTILVLIGGLSLPEMTDSFRGFVHHLTSK